MLPMRPIAGLALLALSTAVAAVLPPGALAPRAAEAEEMHEWMDDMVGVWEGSMRVTRAGSPEMEFEITETFHSVGELWVTSDLVGDLMGQPYHGHDVFGYDRSGEGLVATHCDSMSPHFAVMSGSYEQDGKVLRLTWEAPVSGREGVESHRSEQRLRGDTIVRMYFEGEGANEVLTMTISTKRKVD